MASLIFNWKLVEAEQGILKQSSEQRDGNLQNLSQVKYVEMFLGGEMFADASGEVSTGLTPQPAH